MKMLNQKFTYPATIVLWIGAIWIWMDRNFPWYFVFLAVLHLVELLYIGYKTGRENGCSAIKSIVMCMLFGFLWWLPLLQKNK